jgi:hypothetical protein
MRPRGGLALWVTLVRFLGWRDARHEIDVNAIANSLQDVHERLADTLTRLFLEVHCSDSVQVGCRYAKIRQTAGLSQSATI